MRIHLTSTLLAALTLLPLIGCTKKITEPAKSVTSTQREENIVTLTPANLAHVELEMESVALASFAVTLNAAGRVSENGNKTAKVTSTLEGRITKLVFDINDSVKAGDVLALVQTPELVGKALELKAPLDGVIVERKNSTGELVDKANAIYTISDPADLWVLAEVKEAEIGAVRIGQDASFTVLAFPGEVIRATTVRIAHRVEDTSRTVEVRLEVRNDDGRLKPGMFADVGITTALKDAIVVSDRALQTDGERQVVFVALNDNRFEKRAVAIGERQHGRVEITAGLRPGEKVVTGGSFILKSEMLKSELGEE